MKKEEEIQQAFKKLAALCAKGEHCSGEMLNTLLIWQWNSIWVDLIGHATT